MNFNYSKIFLALFHLTILFGCNYNNRILINDNNDIDNLKKLWIHSTEEEIDSIQIYRPADYKEFPISRYRQKYSFEDSGSCKYLIFASNDAHHFETGFWTYNENNEILIIYNSSQQVIREFKIILLSADLLKFFQIK